MQEEHERRITEALIDQGGPPELALQLIAIAEKELIPPLTLRQWISYHKGEWSAVQFAMWAAKYNDVLRRISDK
jgi:hypothetical protein